MMIAQVINMGDAQAIRLPKELRLPSQTVTIERVPQGLLITDRKVLERRAEFLAALFSSRFHSDEKD